MLWQPYVTQFVQYHHQEMLAYALKIVVSIDNMQAGMMDTVNYILFQIISNAKDDCFVITFSTTGHH